MKRVTPFGHGTVCLGAIIFAKSLDYKAKKQYLALNILWQDLARESVLRPGVSKTRIPRQAMDAVAFSRCNGNTG